MRFAGEAEDDVATDFKAAAAAALDGIDGGVVMVASVHPVERAVVNGLEAVFDGNIDTACQFLQQSKDVIRDAVGAGADGEADDVGVRMGGFVKRTQAIDGGVSVCGGLEIGNEMLNFVAMLETADSVVKLVDDFLVKIGARAGNEAVAAAGAEAAVVAERAAAGGNGAIDIRASESCIQAHFLHALAAKLLPQKKAVGMVTKSGRAPFGQRRLIGQIGR